MVIPSSQRGHYIVGVDFGTTFSCVIFAYSSSGGADEDTKLVQEWPGYSADDVPSLLHYSSVASSEYDWGFQIKRGVRNAPQPLAWFKLLLQHEDGVIPSTHTAASSAHTPPPDSPTPNASPNPDSMVSLFEQFMLASPEGHRAVLDQRLPDPRWNESAADTGASPAQLTKQMLDGLGITADRVVTDYLTALRVHAYEVICRNYGRESVESCRVKYVLTIPAIWSDRAKNRMVRAVSDAGYGVHRQDFHLIGEPEAAAAYVLRTLQPNHLSVGDTFVICDAGGGTVDLISYKIKTLNPLTIDEVVPGTGDLCGSVFLDNRFEAALRAKLGAAFDGLTQKRKSEIMANWDLWVKQPFGNQAPDQDYFDMTAHGLPQFQDDDIDIDEESELRMTLKFIKEMFEPTVSRIIELIDGQVEGAACKGLTVNAILLVGGLGTSQYLFERIQNHAFQGRNIVVMKPGQGKSAIARGALMRGLDGSIVTERRARRHYGITEYKVYHPSEQELYARGWEEHKKWSASEEAYIIDDRMQWYIKRGQAASKEWVRVEFYELVPERVGLGTTSVILYVSDEDAGPSWKTSVGVKPICTLRSDLSGVPLSDLQLYTNKSGQRFRKVSYKLCMRVNDEVLEFTCSSLDGTRQLGKVTVDFLAD